MKTNREAITNMAVYDLLCRMLDNIDNMLKEECICIIESISGNPEPCYGTDCKKCIAAWLNEEVKKP